MTKTFDKEQQILYKEYEKSIAHLTEAYKSALNLLKEEKENASQEIEIRYRENHHSKNKEYIEYHEKAIELYKLFDKETEKLSTMHHTITCKLLTAYGYRENSILRPVRIKKTERTDLANFLTPFEISFWLGNVYNKRMRPFVKKHHQRMRELQRSYKELFNYFDLIYTEKEQEQKTVWEEYKEKKELLHSQYQTDCEPYLKVYQQKCSKVA